MDFEDDDENDVTISPRFSSSGGEINGQRLIVALSWNMRRTVTAPVPKLFNRTVDRIPGLIIALLLLGRVWHLENRQPFSGFDPVCPP
jgi:hypothetical protein